MFSIFANMRVNSEEGLEHLKDSFNSFEQASDDWLINIRGTRRLEVLAFLRERLAGRATFFELLDDSRGWVTNALEMLPHAKYEYVLVWNEDHLCVAPPAKLAETVAEMAQHNVDYLLYSWWQKGRARSAFKPQPLLLGNTIEVFELTPDVWAQALAAGYPYYLLSITGIFKKDFFASLLRYDRRKLPYALTPLLYRAMTALNRLGIRFDQKKYFHALNRLLGFKLRRFPKETPFDLEKAPDRFDILPFCLAVSIHELFACIDDDNNPADRGSSLVARGLYPVQDRLARFAGEPPTGPYPYVASEQSLQVGEEFGGTYYFGSIKSRAHAAREAVVVTSGRVRIVAAGEEATLGPGEGAAFYTNIAHTLTALEPSVVRRFLPDAGLAERYTAR